MKTNKYIHPVCLEPPIGSSFHRLVIYVTAEFRDELLPDRTYFDQLNSVDQIEDDSRLVSINYSLYGGEAGAYEHIGDYSSLNKAIALAKALGATEVGESCHSFDLADWAETHYEVVTRIYESDDSPRVKTAKQYGIGGCWHLAFDLTNQFQKEWIEKEDSAWFTDLEAFLDKELNPPAFEPFDVTKQFATVADAFEYCHRCEYPLRCLEELAQYNIGVGEYGFACELLGYFK